MSSNNHDLAAVLVRLEKLETLNRRMRLVLCIAGVLVGATFVMGQDASKNRIVEAERLVLRDESGKRRIELAGTAKETIGPSLKIYDEEGRIVVWLRGSETGSFVGPALSFHGKHRGKLQKRLGTLPEEALAASETLISLGFDGEETPNLYLQSKGEKTHVSIKALDSFADVSVEKRSGDSASLSVLANSEPGGVVSVRGQRSPFDAKKQISLEDLLRYGSASLSLSKDGSGVLEITDTNGSSRVVLGTTELVGTRTEEKTIRPPSSIVLFDKDGNVIWSAP